MNITQEHEKREWLQWFKRYGARKFIDAFLSTVEGAESTCVYCGEKIYVDVLIGGGVPDWSTQSGDYGCSDSPETNDECCGPHMPVKRT